MGCNPSKLEQTSSKTLLKTNPLHAREQDDRPTANSNPKPFICVEKPKIEQKDLDLEMSILPNNESN